MFEYVYCPRGSTKQAIYIYLYQNMKYDKTKYIR